MNDQYASRLNSIIEFLNEALQELLSKRICHEIEFKSLFEYSLVTLTLLKNVLDDIVTKLQPHSQDPHHAADSESELEENNYGDTLDAVFIITQVSNTCIRLVSTIKAASDALLTKFVESDSDRMSPMLLYIAKHMHNIILVVISSVSAFIVCIIEDCASFELLQNMLHIYNDMIRTLLNDYYNHPGPMAVNFASMVQSCIKHCLSQAHASMQLIVTEESIRSIEQRSNALAVIKESATILLDFFSQTRIQFKMDCLYVVISSSETIPLCDLLQRSRQRLDTMVEKAMEVPFQ